MKKTTKRKMYQKRRKREKAEQRKKETTKLTTTTRSNYNKNTKQNQGNIHSFNPTSFKIKPNAFSHPLSPITSYSQSLQLWWQTYCSAIEFHCQQRNVCMNYSQKQQQSLLEKYANEYETSSEEEEEQNETVGVGCNHLHLDDEAIIFDAADEHVDEEYLKFLEITYKHREELRLRRAQENT